jgi:hypothetical protein
MSWTARQRPAPLSLEEMPPTYVAVWELKDKEICLVEVTYTGTYEKYLSCHLQVAQGLS